MSAPNAALPQLRWPVILFDLDGTLANSLDLIVAAYGHAFLSVTGRVINGADALSWIGETLQQTFTREDPLHAAQLQDVYSAYFEQHADDVVSGYPGVPQLLADLAAAGAVTGVVTAKRRAGAVQTMRLAGLDDVTRLVGTMEDTATHKPDPEPLLAACAVLEADPSVCCYVGDAIYDIQAAHAAGMAGVAVTWGAGIEAELVAQNPVALCHDVDELRQTLLV
ncbi:MAG: HAD-IA family hydrolase [Propionibacteriaceae bacterium]|nr:HAD-IA family hydrolase [Propionibacteriaceae bacterium]